MVWRRQTLEAEAGDRSVHLLESRTHCRSHWHVKGPSVHIWSHSWANGWQASARALKWPCPRTTLSSVECSVKSPLTMHYFLLHSHWTTIKRFKRHLIFSIIMDLTALTKHVFAVCLHHWFCYFPLFYYEAAFKQSLKPYTKENSLY